MFLVFEIRAIPVLKDLAQALEVLSLSAIAPEVHAK
jgi:hypothetical protein